MCWTTTDEEEKKICLKKIICAFMSLHTSFFALLTSPSSSLFLSKANSNSTGELDKLVSPATLTPESEEEQSLPPQRVSTFRPRPYSMADSNKVPKQTYERLMLM